MSREDLGLYNVATLKGILQANHVNARLILEKSELIDKVLTLIETERRERAREQAIHEAEERAMREQQRYRQEQLRAEAERRVQETASQGAHPATARSPPPDRSASPRPSPNVATGYVERDGLCVVCQDEDANVAIVDCGYVYCCLLDLHLHSLQTSCLVYGVLGHHYEVNEGVPIVPNQNRDRATPVAHFQVVTLFSTSLNALFNSPCFFCPHLDQYL